MKILAHVIPRERENTSRPLSHFQNIVFIKPYFIHSKKPEFCLRRLGSVPKCVSLQYFSPEKSERLSWLRGFLKKNFTGKSTGTKIKFRDDFMINDIPGAEYFQS